MSQEAVARRYAQALFELARDEKSLTGVGNGITAFAEAYEVSSDFRGIDNNPALTDEGRDAIVKAIAKKVGAAPMVTRTVSLLAQRSRLAALPEVARTFHELTDVELGIARAEVRAASKLSPAYLDRLKEKMEKATGKKVIITFEEDPSLIAGVVARLGDRVIDGSVRGKLDRLADSLRAH